MQANEQNRSVQPVVTRASCGADCEHRWIFLMPGYQLCSKCGAIRKKPANGTEGAAPHGTPRAVLAPLMERARELSRRCGRGVR